MKHIIDRVITRTHREGSSQGDKEVGKKVYDDLLEKYCCNKPTIKDLQLLFYDLNYDVHKNIETHIKIQSTFELFNHLEVTCQ